MAIGRSMSGCGCNNESSCEGTKLKQNKSETDSCSGADLTIEKNKKSCCDKATASESKEVIKVDACGDNELCSTKAKSCCGTAANNQQQNLNKETGKAALISDYTIPKMDCSAEEQMVRMALAPLSEVKALAFDLPNRKLQVFHTDGISEITMKLEALGFGAKLESTVESTGALPDSPDPTRQAKVLKVLLAINAVLFFIEFISGIIAASTGLIADSLDMFADAAVYGIALYAVGKAAKYQVRAAHFAGWIQLLLAVIVIVDVVRRFMFGSDPESNLMIIIGFFALAANVTCLYLISGHKDSGAHMKASWIFSANDVIVNMGVILAGVLVAWTGSAYPDLIIGIIVSLFVLNGARKILALK